MEYHWTHMTILFQFGIIVYLYNDKFTSYIKISKTLEFEKSQILQIELESEKSENRDILKTSEAKYPIPSKINDLLPTNSSSTNDLLSTNSSSTNLSPKAHKISTPTGKKIIYFMHMHNTAGTTMCHIASAQSTKNKHSKTFKMNTNPSHNCNVYLELTFQDIGAKFGHATPCCGDTIKQQENYAKTSKYTFVANEMFLPTELDFDNYDFVTIFRDPWERYKSHFAHDHPAQKKHMNEWKLKFGRNENAMNSVFLAENFTDWVSAQRDNYFTRKICGPECMEIPRGKLDSSHLEKAKSRLDKFSAVMILENLNESLEILSAKFDWTIPEKYQKTKQVTKTGVNSADRSKLPGIDIRKIRELVTFDDELYAYAVYLSRKQLEEIKIRGRYSKRYQDCENPCCGKCSLARFMKKK